MSRPQSRVGLGQVREVSGTARHNILANISRLEFSSCGSPGHPSQEKIKFCTGDARVRGALALADAGCIIDVAVGIAQLAEHRTVAPTVAGSIPVSHPRISRLPLKGLFFFAACGIAEAMPRYEPTIAATPDMKLCTNRQLYDASSIRSRNRNLPKSWRRRPLQSRMRLRWKNHESNIPSIPQRFTATGAAGAAHARCAVAERQRHGS